MVSRRLLLINPIQEMGGRRQRGWNGNRFVPPLGLAYVAALTPGHWEIRLVDENAGRDAKKLGGFVPDLVGISSYTATIPRAYKLANHFRNMGVKVVIGGCHVTARSEEAMHYADVAFTGQAEGAWPKLVEDFENGQLQPLYHGGMPSLDGLPLPRRDLYPYHYHFDTVLTSKGCPYRCEFCSVWKMYKKRYLLRPIEDVLDEMARISSRYLFLADDNLTADPQRAIELCQGMVERKLNKRFAIQASLEMGQNKELLWWLQQAGCFLVFVGIESVDEATLQHLGKASNLRVGVDRFAETIAHIQSHGMAVSAGIIFGNDEDTLATFRRLETFVVEGGVDSPVYTILTPLPGTDLWERLEAAGRLLDHNLPAGYAYFDAHHVTFQPLRLTVGELQAANREAVRRATSWLALLGSLGRTRRRTGSWLAALASFQNSRWAGMNAR
jgi:radical SAM superfamily enzyme YgiQ (UPF0313 family)